MNEGIALYREFLREHPRSIDAWLAAGNAYVDLWALDDAVSCYAHAAELAPSSPEIVSAWLFHLHYLPAVDARALFDAHRRFVAARAGVPGREFRQTRDPDRHLRIGYVSPNFSRHSVGYFVEPVLRAHDRGQFEVYCYYTHARADDATQRMRATADGWREIAAASDDAVEHMIRDDRIDVLVDLAGHSKGNRLGVFARRPAPVQLTWLGYPDTTGAEFIDYRITDAVVDPPPHADAYYSENLIRVDGTFLCYLPPADAPPVIPCASRPPVFGSFNNIAKLNEVTIALWAEILARVPNARLVLKSRAFDFPDTLERVIEAFERHEVDASRIEFARWRAARDAHLADYSDIDVALDTYPYNGTTTTCEALWMGVPVVTRTGETHMSRVGASLLHSIGLDEYVASDNEGYVERAAALARDATRRNSLRTGLRERMSASALLDSVGFTRRLEACMRTMWRAYAARAARD